MCSHERQNLRVFKTEVAEDSFGVCRCDVTLVVDVKTAESFRDLLFPETNAMLNLSIILQLGIAGNSAVVLYYTV